MPSGAGDLVGVDTGGTFTDLVNGAGDVRKVPSTPADPAKAVAVALDGARPALLAHGTTVATNALLQRRLARVALVTTRGFADVIEIARQARPSLYDPHVDRPPALVPRHLRFEVGGRLDASGGVVEAFDGALPAALVDALTAGALDAVAVCLLHADLAGTHEIAVRDAIERAAGDRQVIVRCSHEVAREFREYERTVTTVVDAGLQPLCARYLDDVARLAADALVMTSAGGLVPIEAGGRHPAALLLSGPAAGVRAAAAIAGACGYPHAVGFDMGGTSTDVCLVRDGAPEPSPSLVVGGYPIRLPSLAVHTIGAGGGSIARVDPGGALIVGPESAGADPGPACYGHGGIDATVTDADLVLGHIPAGTQLPGLGVLDADRARDALARLGIGTPDEAAAQAVRVVDAEMARAVRRVSADRGLDPRQLALVAFGGAGPLHACAVAAELGMRTVIVPPRAGVFSAVGLLCSPRQEEIVRSWPAPLVRDGIVDALRALVAEARARFDDGDTQGTDDTAVGTQCWLDCRYAGQSHELAIAHSATTPAWEAFHAEHEARNGFARPDAPVEVIALRARATRLAALAVDRMPPPSARRDPVRGPAVAAEADCTVWIPDGWAARVDPGGAWVIERA